MVAVDPSAPFAAALREVLTQVRQRVHGHRGRKANDSWAYRRLLLRGARHLSDRQWRRLRALFDSDNSTGEIQTLP